MTEERQSFEIIDNPLVTEIYANKLVSVSFDGGAVVITVGTLRMLPQSGAPKRSKSPVHVTARLALSPTGAAELANVLGNLLKKLGKLKQKVAIKDASLM